MNKYKTISFSDFERKSGSDWSASTLDYSQQSWFRRGLEKSSKKRGCKSCKKDCSDGFCDFKNCSEYSPQAIARTIPVMHHEKHRECFKKFSFLVDSNDGRKAFRNYLHHPKCYETKCHEDCCLSGLSRLSASCSSSSSSSGCPQKSASSSSSSDQIELLYALFLDFIKMYNTQGSALTGASESKIVKEKVLKISIEKMPAGDVMVVEGKVKDGKRGSRINPTLSVRVGEKICFDVSQYTGGKHQFALFAKGSSAPLAGSPMPMMSGKLCYTITADTPKSFQYGALDDGSLSGVINVIA